MSTRTIQPPPDILSPYAKELWHAAQLCILGPDPSRDDPAEDYFQTQANFKAVCRPARMFGMLNAHAAALAQKPVKLSMTSSSERDSDRIKRLEDIILKAAQLISDIDDAHSPARIPGDYDADVITLVKSTAAGIHAFRSTPEMLARVENHQAAKQYGGTRICPQCHRMHGALESCPTIATPV